MLCVVLLLVKSMRVLQVTVLFFMNCLKKQGFYWEDSFYQTIYHGLGWLNKFSGLEQRADKCFKGLDNIYDKGIEEHRDPERFKPEHEDLVDVLLRVQKDPNQAIALTNDQMKDIFIGGTDTTTSTLVWTVAELIRNPAALTKAQIEVRELIKNKGKVEESDLSQLMYLKSVIKEGLRLHPPFMPLQIPRQTIQILV